MRFSVSGFEPGWKLRGLQPRHEIPQPLDRIPRLHDPFFGEIQLAAIGNRKQQKSNRGGLVPAREKIAQRIEVAERFRHLLAFDNQMLGVQPGAHELLAGGGFALRDFVFVVRKGEIDAAGVNIERVAQILHGHRGALDVPAGASRPDPRLPEMLAGFRRLPQREIARVVLFVLIHVHARAGLHPGHIDLGKSSVRRKFRDAEIDRAFALVRETLFLQLLDQRDHVFDVIGRADQLFGHLDMQRVNILEKRLNVFVGVLADADSRQRPPIG